MLRERLEETNELAHLVVREIERRHVDLEVRAHAVAIGVGVAERRILQELLQPLGRNPRAFGEKFGRQLVLVVAVLLQSHQYGRLAGIKLVAAHAVVFLNDPPALLNVALRVAGLVDVAVGQGSFLAAHQERG